jgi:outer membrane protein assembly factor BamB
VVQANVEGVFEADGVVIPASALPGRRPIAVQGRNSGTRATVPFLVRTNWPQFHRGTFRHGETPHENVLGPDNVAQLRLLWDVPAGLQIDLAMQGSPVLANGLVYLLTSSAVQGRLLALDAATGVQRWSQPIGYSPAGCGTTPAVVQGRVYAPASRRMAAFDARTGAVRWRVGEAFCSTSATPTVLNGKLFTTTFSGPNVEARDAASGRLLWSRRVCIGTPPACSYATSYGPLAAGDGIVYVTNSSGAMAAYDVDTGRQLWSRRIGVGVIDSAPVVEGDVVYISVHDDRLYALNRRTGAELWSAPTGHFNHSTPALAYGLLYVGSDRSGVSAIDAQTGAVRWQQTALGTVRTSPAVANGVVYLGAGDGKLYALDARTGAVLHSRQIAPAGRILSPSPVVADGKLYVGTGDRLLAFGL